MKPILTILIPTMPSRAAFLYALQVQLCSQLFILHENGFGPKIQILHDEKEYGSIGNKRNAMVARVETEYMAFIDDDDRISDTYINDVLAALQSNPDCCSLRGKYYLDGVFQADFEHSMKYDRIANEGGLLIRPVNHLNVIRTSIVRQIPYQDMHFSEDSRFAIDLMASGLLKTEAWIEPALYHYFMRSDKRILG